MASKLLSDLESIQKFLLEQKEALGETAQAVQGGQHDRFCSRLSSMTLTVDEATAVTSKIGQRPWTEARRKKPAGACGHVSEGWEWHEAAKPDSSGVQPQSDLNTLRSSASMVLKLDLVAELMTKLKLILPSEQTSHLVIRPLLALSLNEMPFHDCFKEFKRVFRLKTKGSWICWRMLRSWAWSQRPTTPRRPQTRKFFRTATLAQNHCKRKPRKKWKKNQPTKNSEHEEECGGTAGRA